MTRSPAKRVAFYAAALILSLALSYLEILLPLPIPLPGVKLGLANLITLLLLIDEKPQYILLLLISRVILCALLFGTFISFIYSLSGAALSFAGMLLIKRLYPKRISLVGVSVTGACMHNIGQVIAACMILGSAKMLYYLPPLILVAIVTGFVVGLCANILSPRLKKAFSHLN